MAVLLAPGCILLPNPCLYDMKVSLESGGILGTLSILSISGEPYAPSTVGERLSLPAGLGTLCFFSSFACLLWQLSVSTLRGIKLVVMHKNWQTLRAACGLLIVVRGVNAPPCCKTQRTPRKRYFSQIPVILQTACTTYESFISYLQTSRRKSVGYPVFDGLYLLQ